MAQLKQWNDGELDCTIIAEPQPGPQTWLLMCPCFEIFFGGARGGGKTHGMLLEWVSHQALFGAAASGLMVRRTFKQLEDTIKEAKRLFIPLGAKWTSGGEKQSTFVFPGGAELKFRHLDSDSDAEQFMGQSFTRVYVEEIGNFPNPSPIFKLMATLRSASGVPCGFRATGNPGGPGHQWVKGRYITPAPLGFKVITESFTNPFDNSAIPRDRVYIPSRLTDNKYLGAEYIANLQQSGSPKLVNAWLLGDWSVIEGAFFDNWSDAKHIIRPFALPGSWSRFRSMDWGSASPFCVGWYTVVGDARVIQQPDGRRLTLPRGCLIKYREWYGARPHSIARNTGLKMTVERVADGILALEKDEPRTVEGKTAISYGVADPAMFADAGGPTHAERMAKKGVVWTPADHKRTARDNKFGGWDMIRMRLDGDDDGRPMLVCFDTCVDTIRTLPEVQHDPAKPEDVDTEGEDHAADETRYACMSRPFIRRGKTAEPPALSEADEYGRVKIDLDRLFKDQDRKNRRLSLGGRI